MFETRKIQSETLGEYLKAVRTTFNLSIKEVSDRTGVNDKLLASLEFGNMKNLPADVYVIGALKKLADFYGLVESDLVFQYKKERLIASQIFSKENSAAKQLAYFWKNFVITPKVLAFFTTVIFVVFTLVYLFWQVSSINRAPSLQIFSPQDQSIIATLSVKVTGQTDLGANTTVNGQEIFVDSQGKFSTEISLAPGTQEIDVVAKNRFGKETVKSVKVFIKQEQIAEQALVLELIFLGNSDLTYIPDDENQDSRSFKAGEDFKIIAKNKIVLSASDGGAIKGILNGQSLGILGKAKEPLKNLVFSPESINQVKQ